MGCRHEWLTDHHGMPGVIQKNQNVEFKNKIKLNPPVWSDVEPLALPAKYLASLASHGCMLSHL